MEDLLWQLYHTLQGAETVPVKIRGNAGYTRLVARVLARVSELLERSHRKRWTEDHYESIKGDIKLLEH